MIKAIRRNPWALIRAQVGSQNIQGVTSGGAAPLSFYTDAAFAGIAAFICVYR